ncbi:hypothetical protein ACFL0F_00475 [Patescibacteria group bacterium]
MSLITLVGRYIKPISKIFVVVLYFLIPIILVEFLLPKSDPIFWRKILPEDKLLVIYAAFMINLVFQTLVLILVGITVEYLFYYFGYKSEQ